MGSRPPGSELCGYVVQAAGAGVWAWDVVNDVLTADTRCQEIMSSAPRDLVFRTAAEAGGEFNYDHRLTTADGESRWVRLCGHAETDEAGAVVRCVGVMREVTSEHRLRESEERLRFIVSRTHDGAWDLDVATGRVWLSDDMLATLGLARDLCPRDLDAALALVHPEDQAVVRAGLEELLTGRRPPRRRTVRLRHSGGGWRHIESWTAAATDPESGRATRLAGIVHDRTDPARLGDRLPKLASRLTDSVLEPIESATRHVKLAALAVGSSPERLGDLIEVASVDMDRARDAVEELIQADLLRSLGDDG